jgi:hypothetical protein
MPALRPRLGAAEAQIADVDLALTDLRARPLRDAVVLSALCRQRRLLEHLAHTLRQQARAAATAAGRPA